MNLRKEIWTKEDYQEFCKFLESIREDEYKKFHQRLTPTKYEILGIRVPMQRKIAKEILKGNYESFLSLCDASFYEVVNIEGFVIGGIKDEKVFETYFFPFLSKIDNWAICDGFCNGLKIVEKKKEKYFEVIKKLLQSSHIYEVRVGLVLLLSFYVEEEYVNEILKLARNLKSEEYYINMALAWLVAECFIKYPDVTFPFLKEQILNKFTQNKTISKIRDSYRVSKEMKEVLKNYRII